MDLIFAVVTVALGLNRMYDFDAVVAYIMLQLPKLQLAALANLLDFLVSLSWPYNFRFARALVERRLSKKCVKDVVNILRVRMRVWVICSFSFLSF